MKAMILDLETQNHEFHEDVASPFHPLNYIVAPAFSINDGPVQSWYFTSREEADASDWFKVPDDVSLIVAHNMQFECLWLLHRHREEFETFLRRGGRVLCTQLAEYLLSNQQELYPKLDETAPKYGGTHKIDAVKLLWEQGYLTSQIDKALLMEYLAGPEGDIVNTRITFFGQCAKLVEAGLWQTFLDRCDAQLYSAYCKFFGCKVDTAKADSYRETMTAEVEQKLAALTETLPALADLKTDVPIQSLTQADLVAQFNFGSDFHLSALLFGGPIRLIDKVSYDPVQFVKDDFYHFENGEVIRVADYEDTDPKAREELFQSKGSLVVFKSGKNKGQPKVFREDTPEEKLKQGKVKVFFPGVVKFSDLPDDVAQNFIGKRAEFRGKRFLCDHEETPEGQVLVAGTPVYSTSGEVMDLLITHTGLDLPTKLLDLADEMKILGTYFNGLFIKNVMPDGMLRAQINHVSTKTGRLSSKLQQMPRVETEDFGGEERMTYGSQVKECLTTRFPGGSVIECDYTALEVVHLATLSGDKALLRYLQDGTDMHCLRLAAKLHSDYDTVKGIVKNEEHPEHNRYKNLRQGIKPLSFQYQYGGTAPGMSYKTGCTVEEAEEFIQNELKLFPESSAYRYTIEQEVLDRAKNAPISREQDPETGAWKVYRSSYSVGPSGTRYSYRQYPKTHWADGKKVETMEFKISQLANYQCQGEASLVMQVATGLIIRWLLKEEFFDDQAVPFSTVHDAAYLDTANYLTTTVGHKVKALMEEAPKVMAKRYPGYATLKIDEVPYPAVPEAGQNLAVKTHI